MTINQGGLNVLSDGMTITNGGLYVNGRYIYSYLTTLLFLYISPYHLINIYMPYAYDL